MSDPESNDNAQYNLFDDAPREGVYDEQLHFPSPLVAEPQAFEFIVKRDGRKVRFDKSKIAEAIYKAALSIGGQDRDRADSLASGVAIYLRKRIGGGTPTVDDVQDAVEKVLIEMGHARTALAFARYRDKRARIRRLRQGDIRALLDEFEEARQEQTSRAGDVGLSLFVRTSEDTLVGWDRARIVDALVRETRLETRLAELIAMEVEQQIFSAGVGALTAPLIRELVDAKLIEHGLEDYRRRHMRLGVPLYDAERIICFPGESEHEGGKSPETTDLVLAERVKKEFALTQVFSREVADAHLLGSLHLCGLGLIDRLHGAAASLEYVSRFGGLLPGASGVSHPPGQLDTLLVQLGQFRSSLSAHFAWAPSWETPNVFIAPFLEKVDQSDWPRAAHILLHQLGMKAGLRAGPSEVMISVDVPERLKGASAIGPGGLPTGKVYGDYADVTQRFAFVLLDAYRENMTFGGANMPALTIRVAENMFDDPLCGGFLHRAVELALVCGCVHLAFDRGDCAEARSRALWQASGVTVSQVTLNLPRAAFRAGSEDALYAELDNLVDLAVKAHQDKRDFLDRLMSLKGLGPMALLASEKDGVSYVDMARAKYLVAVEGLNECVQCLCGREMHECDGAFMLGRRIMSHLAERCRAVAAQEGMRIVPAHSADIQRETRRFAALDLRPYPEQTRQVVKSEPVTQDLHYTPAACLRRGNGVVSPSERAAMEGEFHEIAPAGALTRIGLPDAHTSSESVLSLIKDIAHRTRSRRVVLER